jgi:hypothetical protein
MLKENVMKNDRSAPVRYDTLQAACRWIGVLLLSAYAGGPAAQQRMIFVNGQLLTTADIAVVDALNCGKPVPNGNYWLNFERRQWGYVGVPGANPLPDCRTERSSSGGSSSGGSDCAKRYRVYEDRMCYCYNVC